MVRPTQPFAHLVQNYWPNHEKMFEWPKTVSRGSYVHFLYDLDPQKFPGNTGCPRLEASFYILFYPILNFFPIIKPFIAMDRPWRWPVTYSSSIWNPLPRTALFDDIVIWCRLQVNHWNLLWKQTVWVFLRGVYLTRSTGLIEEGLSIIKTAKFIRNKMCQTR